MKFEKRVGLEAEYLTLDEQGEIVLTPGYVERDDFPLMGEIRGKPGSSTSETVANFIQRKMEVEKALSPQHTMSIQPSANVKLAVYREAMRACQKPKNEMASEAANIYGVDITDFSDQIIEDGKIQGIKASCGLHLHFSCRAVDREEVREPHLTHVQLPIRVEDATSEGHKSLIRPYVDLYKKDGYDVTKMLEATTSLLNRPTVEWMVRSLDERFFEKFAGPEEERTKYRQAGFYELKEHGFEYRSLPASQEVLDALPEIVEAAFELLKYASEYV
jgi:hypothetical protein